MTDGIGHTSAGKGHPNPPSKKGGVGGAHYDLISQKHAQTHTHTHTHEDTQRIQGPVD